MLTSAESQVRRLAHSKSCCTYLDEDDYRTQHDYIYDQQHEYTNLYCFQNQCKNKLAPVCVGRIRFRRYTAKAVARGGAAWRGGAMKVINPLCGIFAGLLTGAPPF